MKRKIIYTDAPPEIEEAFARSVRVRDFLPSPSELVLKKSDNKQEFLKPQPKSHYASARPKTSAMA